MKAKNYAVTSLYIQVSGSVNLMIKKTWLRAGKSGLREKFTKKTIFSESTSDIYELI